MPDRRHDKDLVSSVVERDAQSARTPSRHEEEWDRLATIDPLWAILSDPGKRSGGWETSEFLATGERDVAQLLEVVERGGLPVAHESALDFGCGVGRLTRALAGRFSSTVGIDISEEMVRKASAMHAEVAGLAFVHDSTPNLSTLEPRAFDLVLSLFVLQHLPSPPDITRVTGVLADRVRPGGVLILQIPMPVPLRHRVQPRRRLYAVLRSLGLDDEVLHRRLRLSPIRMTGLAQHSVREILRVHGLRVLEVHTDVFAGTTMVSNVYFAAR